MLSCHDINLASVTNTLTCGRKSKIFSTSHLFEKPIFTVVTVKFSQVSVNSVHRGRGSASVHEHPSGNTPLQAGSPPGQVHPSARYTLQAGSHPWAGTHPLAGCRYTLGRLGRCRFPGAGSRYIPLGSFSPHPHPHDFHCSGRYASYWNAFLFVILIETVKLT